MPTTQPLGLVSSGLLLAFIASTGVGQDRQHQVPELDNPPSPQVVVPPGSFDLAIESDFDLGGFIFKSGYPFLHNDGGTDGGNTALGLNALRSSTPGVPFPTSGTVNTALGSDALRNNTEGAANTAIGFSALYKNTTGYSNTASGSYALFSNTLGVRNTANGTSALIANTLGESNTAVGAFALLNNISGSYNAAIGMSALRTNTAGDRNVAVGASSLQTNTSGVDNAAIGHRALFMNGVSSRNTALGSSALYGNTGSNNTATGAFALATNTSGAGNTALGYSAGGYNSTGSNNIWIGNLGVAPGVESNTLRIGNGTGTGSFEQDRAFISGVRNANGNFNQVVCVNSTSDQLGPCGLSSARFKEDIGAIADESETIFDLRPVKFRYKEEFVDAGGQPVQYGLIAEEVARLFPQLVTTDADGLPITVRYAALTPLLLNELKKQRLELAELRATKARVEEQEAVLRELRGRLERLEAAGWSDPAL